ncbi:hypothetical protein Efla_001750 [Eimeria flavescens]
MLLSGHATSLNRWCRHLPQLCDFLRKAEFVSLDLELTGLHARSEKFLGVDPCYAAHAEGARGFMPVQLGLCAARRSEADASRWILTPASIYIFPRDPRIFQATTSTLKFLRQNAFDFNEWISRGIPYTRRQARSPLPEAAPFWPLYLVCGLVLYVCCLQEENDERAALMRRIEELRNLQARPATDSSQAATVSGKAMAISPFEAATEEDRLLAESVRRAIKEWSSRNPEEPLELPVSSPLQRLLLHSLVAAEFPHLFSNSCIRGEQRVFAVYSTERQVFEEQLRHLEGELRAVEDSRGARELLELVSREGLLVVGHCCFYDFLHLYQSFVEDLPQGVADFKKKWNRLFPCTFDTKLLAETHESLVPLGTPATLKDLCELMVGASVGASANGKQSRQPTFEVAPLEGTTWKLDALLSSVIANGGASEENAATPAEAVREQESFLPVKAPQQTDAAGREAVGSEFAHDAGYDSLMTTMVFLMQVGHVLEQKGLLWEDLHFRPPVSPSQSMGSSRSPVAVQDILSQYVSRVRLVRTQPPSINLGGKDDQQIQQQKRLLLMRNFPPTWQKWNIMKLWSPVWVDVQPIDSSACWLVTRTDEDARSLLTIYEMMPSKDFELMTYDDYRRLQSEQANVTS